MGKLFKHKSTRIWAVVTAIVIVLTIVVNLVCICLPIASNSLSLVFGGETANIVEDYRDEWYDRQYDSKEEALAAAKSFVIRVEEEGITLLKNEEKALPLAAGARVSVFGKNAVSPVYGGSGSAGSNSAGYTTLYEALEASGIVTNEVLRAFYEDNARSGEGRPANPNMDSGQRLAGFATGETPISSFDDTLRQSYAGYQDAALVVISRIGGEGFDLPRTMATDFSYTTPVEGAADTGAHYLQLDENEQAMIEEAKAHFEKVVIILNVGTTMEIGALRDDPDIDAILWIGLPGSTGMTAVGEILIGQTLSGEQISPSGHTIDTWARDFTLDPTWYNTGVYSGEFGNRYLNADGSQSEFAFVNYEEGIYVGYRYYETRGAEEGEAWYEENVVYPFGYGLSYTEFSREVAFDNPDATVTSEDTVGVSVTVTNEGEYSGRDVVQLYYGAPYTEGGIEKSAVVLGAFAKTSLLAPGESETLTLSLPVSDMKSYDYADANGNGFTGYELEAGDYTIFVSGNAHTPYAETTVTVADEEKIGENEIVNRFDDVSAGIFGEWNRESFVSRADFAGTMRTDYLTDEERTLTAPLQETLEASIKRTYAGDDQGKPWEVNASDMPSTTPVNNGISLRDMLYDDQGNLTGSVSYDDPRWDALLDEISPEEMKLLVGFGAFRTNAVAGIDNVVDKPLTNDADGPTGFTSFLSESVFYDTCAYQAECVMGATWNTALAFEMGQMVGEEGLAGNEKGDGMPYSGWYAPAVNIHRSPFAGRNWEYYSEDGYLSGAFAAEVVKGARTKGVYTYVKHFAVNDQETDREYNGILVWANEQSMREIYLKPFELAVTEGRANGMMSSFNRLGLTWAGGSYALLTGILRDEWGFKGMVITDYSMNRYTYVDLMIRAGGDLFLTQDSKVFNMPDDATQITALRKATKNILYTTVNSNIMSIRVDGYKAPVWQRFMYVIDAVIVGLLALWGVMALRGAKKGTAILSEEKKE